MNPKDPSNFRQFILDTPNQFKVGMELAKNIKIQGQFSSVMVSGMGGSALPVDLVRTYLADLFKRDSRVKPFEVGSNRYYSLPAQSKSKSCLNFITSYSGNTEESISALKEARDLGLPVVTFSSGGKIEEMANELNLLHIKLPIPFPNYQPRIGTGYFFGAMVQLFINHGLIPDVSIELLDTAETFHNGMASFEARGKDLSGKLNGKTPIIYASDLFRSVAMVWKIKMNENAKTPAFWNYFPELNHNEMVGFTNPQAKFYLVMLKDPDDNPMNLKRYTATADLLKEKDIESEIIELEGKDVFSKMFLSITLADWTSYYLALEYGQDPTPVDMVEKLKKILAS